MHVIMRDTLPAGTPQTSRGFKGRDGTEMAKTRVTIVKSVGFQGRVEEFQNVYNLDGPEPTPDDGTGLINALVAIEKPLHAGEIKFVRGYCSYDDSGLLQKPTYRSIQQKLLEGGGTSIKQGFIYKECAVLLQLRIGVRHIIPKWYHCWAVENGDQFGVSLLTTGTTEPFQAAGNQLLAAINTNWYIATPDNDRPVQARVYPYLEHRQFHAGKKRTGILG